MGEKEEQKYIGKQSKRVSIFDRKEEGGRREVGNIR